MAKKAKPKPPTPDNPELTDASDWLPAEITIYEAAAAPDKSDKSDEGGEKKKRLRKRKQRKITEAIINRFFHRDDRPDVATVMRKIEEKGVWEDECSRQLTDPTSVRRPSPQTITRILLERETQRRQTPPAL